MLCVQKSDPKFGIDNSITELIFHEKRAFIQKIQAEKAKNWTPKLGLKVVSRGWFLIKKNGIFSVMRAHMYGETWRRKPGRNVTFPPPKVTLGGGSYFFENL